MERSRSPGAALRARPPAPACRASSGDTFPFLDRRTRLHSSAMAAAHTSAPAVALTATTQLGREASHARRRHFMRTRGMEKGITTAPLRAHSRPGGSTSASSDALPPVASTRARSAAAAAEFCASLQGGAQGASALKNTATAELDVLRRGASPLMVSALGACSARQGASSFSSRRRRRRRPARAPPSSPSNTAAASSLLPATLTSSVERKVVTAPVRTSNRPAIRTASMGKPSAAP